jgi:hypothetical protein
MGRNVVQKKCVSASLLSEYGFNQRYDLAAMIPAHMGRRPHHSSPYRLLKLAKVCA